MSIEKQSESSESLPEEGGKHTAEPESRALELEPKTAMFGGDRAPEFGGREGPEPTRYGDWEKNGRCIDF